MDSESSKTRLLLISNSTLHGSGYLDHAESEIHDFLGDAKKVLFVPYALYDMDKYAAQARARFAKMGYELNSIHGVVKEEKQSTITEIGKIRRPKAATRVMRSVPGAIATGYACLKATKQSLLVAVILSVC